MKGVDRVQGSPVPVDVACERQGETITLRNRVPLKDAWPSLPAVLTHWAERTPDAPFLCERDKDGGWRRKSYGEVRDSVHAIAARLLALGCNAQRPLVIISPNSILHAELALAAQYIGAPSCPLSLAYATATTNFERLRTMVETVGAAAIFFGEPERCAAAIEAVKDFAPIIAAENENGSSSLPLFSIEPVEPALLEEAAAVVGPDSIARLLFTSGSTGKPKAVINTQRMLCANQAMLQQIYPVFTERPPIMVDWLPWSHTFGANFTFGIALFNGGAYHIDAGKPVPPHFETTLENLADIRPTVYFNVPAGYEALLTALEADRPLAERMFSRLDFLFCAAAALPQSTRDGLRTLARDVAGRDIPIYSGWGSTETAPCATATWFKTGHAGNIGSPLPGVEVRLVPDGDKRELRVKGPTVMPGYWRNPEASAAARDEDGFYRMGDAGHLVDPDRPDLGIVFDGRVSENFKLLTGTWVSVGALRLEIVNSGHPWIRDVVVAGQDRAEIGILAFLNHAACRQLVGDAEMSDKVLSRHPAVVQQVKSILQTHNKGRGSSTRVARVMLLEDAPSIERYEITDKGYLNQRAVLSARAQLVSALYENEEYRV